MTENVEETIEFPLIRALTATSDTEVNLGLMTVNKTNPDEGTCVSETMTASASAKNIETFVKF